MSIVRQRPSHRHWYILGALAVVAIIILAILLTGRSLFPSLPPLQMQPIAAVSRNGMIFLRFGDCQSTVSAKIELQSVSKTGKPTGVISLSYMTTVPGSFQVADKGLADSDALFVKVGTAGPEPSSGAQPEQPTLPLSILIGIRDMRRGPTLGARGSISEAVFQRLGSC